jgi:putative endonuclease
MNSRIALGAAGETRAAQYLMRRGYRIVARNVRADRVEIDIIARRGRVLAFVEVKTRRTRAYGYPEDAVDARKRARLVRGAAAWLHENRGQRRSGQTVRFDVVACECTSNQELWQIRHLKGAFDADG